jgi:para-aminobenzoate synthetase
MSILSVDPAMTLRYSTLHRQINIQGRHKQRTISLQQNQGTTFFDYISGWMKQLGDHVPVTFVADRKQGDDDRDVAPPQLAFLGGLVGYFGYEMKRESMDGYQTPLEQQCHCTHHSEEDTTAHCCECMEEPDAAFHFVDRFWVFDHSQQQIYVCGLLNETTNNDDGLGFNTQGALTAWMGSAEKMILHTTENIRRRQRADEFISLTPNSSTCTTPIPKSMVLDQGAPVGSDLFTANVQHDAYLESIQHCVQQIKEGESYEICLTTRFRLTLPNDAIDGIHALWKLYTQHLRKNNPAPFSALLEFPGDDGARLPAFSLLSSSPERFLKVQGGVAEMKPIKGTMARALQCQCPPHECDFGPRCEQLKSKEEQARKQRLWEDVKERAENLMVRVKENGMMMMKSSHLLGFVLDCGSDSQRPFSSV